MSGPIRPVVQDGVVRRGFVVWRAGIGTAERIGNRAAGFLKEFSNFS